MLFLCNPSNCWHHFGYIDPCNISGLNHPSGFSHGKQNLLVQDYDWYGNYLLLFKKTLRISIWTGNSWKCRISLSNKNLFLNLFLIFSKAKKEGGGVKRHNSTLKLIKTSPKHFFWKKWYLITDLFVFQIINFICSLVRQIFSWNRIWGWPRIQPRNCLVSRNCSRHTSTKTRNWSRSSFWGWWESPGKNFLIKSISQLLKVHYTEVVKHHFHLLNCCHIIPHPLLGVQLGAGHWGCKGKTLVDLALDCIWVSVSSWTSWTHCFHRLDFRWKNWKYNIFGKDINKIKTIISWL